MVIAILFVDFINIKYAIPDAYLIGGYEITKNDRERVAGWRRYNDMTAGANTCLCLIFACDVIIQFLGRSKIFMDYGTYAAKIKTLHV